MKNFVGNVTKKQTDIEYGNCIGILLLLLFAYYLLNSYEVKRDRIDTYYFNSCMK